MGFWRGAGNFLTFGAIDRIEAKSITTEAKKKEDEARNELEDKKRLTQENLEQLGILKENIYSTTLTNFVSSYEAIGQVDLSPLKRNNDSLRYKKLDVDIIELKNVTVKLKEIGLVGGGAAVGGAIAVYGAMGLATTIGTASTGTAIGTLSGAAATNATLAWLGGGAVASGGAGVAGGMIVLGGVALAPAVLLCMFLATNKGKQKLNHAKEYSAQVDAIVSKVMTLIAELAQIRRGCYLLTESIKALDKVLTLHVSKMDQIAYRLDNRTAISRYIIDPVKKNVFNMSLLTKEEAQIFCDSVNCASLLKQLIEKPLMNEEGAFLSDILEFLKNKETDISKMINMPDDQLLEYTSQEEVQLELLEAS